MERFLDYPGGANLNTPALRIREFSSAGVKRDLAEEDRRSDEARGYL